MQAPLFRTKLYLPAARAELVVRRHLLDRLTAGLSCKLILISAPAGYGKTTLLSTWAVASGFPVAWLSLDESDNDPARFLAYLTAAFQSAGVYPETDPMQQMTGMLQSFQPIRVEDFMPVLINQMESMARPFVLVLDDYHCIKHPEIHKAVTFLIDYQPPQMHFALTTREDPPLPVSRLRARGQLLELRQADLRFTPEETAVFLSQWGGVELLSSDAALFTGRTEGWVAGLQMATLALQRALASQSDSVPNRQEISRIVACFGGGHEYIVDYFNAEVFAQQPEAVKTFLLQTSVLDQLCGPLCEAVTGQPDGQKMLEQLQKANMFVIALDQERSWYRYHHLFCDLLRKQLQQQTPELLPELHRRASQWYEEHHMIDQAFQHALAAHDQEKIGWILDEYTEEVWRRGEWTTLSQRIDALTPDQLEVRPELMIARAIIFGQNGNFEEAERILSEIDQTLSQMANTVEPTGLRAGMNPVRQPQHLIGLAKAARAQVGFMHKDPQVVLHYARQALDHLAKFDLPWDVPWKCQILISMSDAYLLTGDIPAAIQALVEAIPFGRAYHHHALLLEALTKQAMAYWMQGNLSEADLVCQEGLAYIAENDLGSMPITAGLWVVWGWVQTERNELESAFECLQHGLRNCQAGPQSYFQYFGYAAMLRFWLAKGDLETAETFVRPAEILSQKTKIPAWLETVMSGLKLLLWVKQGRLDETEQDLHARRILVEDEVGHPYQPLYYALARLLLAQGDPPAAAAVLNHLTTQPAQQVHWIRLVWITRALIYLRQHDFSRAIQALSTALSQAARDRCIQVFLDEGEPVTVLLSELLRQQPGTVFAEQLWQAFARKTQPAPLETLSSQQEGLKTSPDQHFFPQSQSHPLHVEPTVASPRDHATQNMLEPLSRRELEILGLIADGLSNQQIAARLYLSLRTVKFHTSNIYSKLEVESRTEAVARARKLKLIA